MRIAQISDLHFTHLTWNPLRLLSKRILGNLNWIFARKAIYSHDQLAPLPELFSELKVDLILWGGDFTTTALTEEYEKASRFVSQFSQDWIAVPGNHDHYTYRSWLGKHFYDFFSNKRDSISHPVDFFSMKDHGVEAHRIFSPKTMHRLHSTKDAFPGTPDPHPTKDAFPGTPDPHPTKDAFPGTPGRGAPLAPQWWIIALDTARATNPYSSRGLFTEKMESYLEEILQMIPTNDSVICFNHYPFFPQDEARRNLERGQALQDILRRSPQIRLYLHGHTHRHAIADLQPNNLPILLDSGCPVQGKEGTWNLIDLMPDHCAVTGFRWTNRWEPFRRETMKWQR